MNLSTGLVLLVMVAAIWLAAVQISRRRVRACDGSGDPNHGIIVFAEPVRWLFVVWGFAWFCRGLRRAGCRQQVRLFRWCGAAGALLVLPDFVRRRRLRRKARRLARFLEQTAEQHPEQPIHVVGYSTGSFLVLEALKQVGPQVRLGEVILLAAAVSPGYEVNDIAGRVPRVHSFHSYADFLISGLGPLLFGSNDGHWGPGCGMVGWRNSDGFVVQHPWSASAIPLSYFGDHFTITAPAFVAKRIAPILGA